MVFHSIFLYLVKKNVRNTNEKLKVNSGNLCFFDSTILQKSSLTLYLNDDKGILDNHLVVTWLSLVS